MSDGDSDVDGADDNEEAAAPRNTIASGKSNALLESTEKSAKACDDPR